MALHFPHSFHTNSNSELQSKTRFAILLIIILRVCRVILSYITQLIQLTNYVKEAKQETNECCVAFCVVYSGFSV